MKIEASCGCVFDILRIYTESNLLMDRYKLHDTVNVVSICPEHDKGLNDIMLEGVKAVNEVRLNNATALMEERERKKKK